MKLTLGEKLKDERVKRKLTSKQVCEEIKKRYNYNLSIGKYNEIESDVSKDFGYKAFIYLSKFFEVSTDYLLGLSENPSTDPDITNACNITGLSENAIKTLEKLNTPLNIKDCEVEYILNKQRNVAELMHNGRYVSQGESLTDEERIKLQEILTHEKSEEVIEILNNLLSVCYDNQDFDWETYGIIILRCIYDYCKRDFPPITYKVEDIAGSYYKLLSPDTQRSTVLNDLIITVQELREKLKEREQNGKYNPTKK